eukprot:3683305-Karenia_brevis.AAC.1
MTDKVAAKALLDKKTLTSIRLQTLLRAPAGLCKAGMENMTKSAAEVLNADDARKACESVTVGLNELQSVWDSADAFTESQHDCIKNATQAVAAGALTGSCLVEDASEKVKTVLSQFKESICAKMQQSLAKLPDNVFVETERPKLTCSLLVSKVLVLLMPCDAHNKIYQILEKMVEMIKPVLDYSTSSNGSDIEALETKILPGMSAMSAESQALRECDGKDQNHIL